VLNVMGPIDVLPVFSIRCEYTKAPPASILAMPEGSINNVPASAIVMALCTMSTTPVVGDRARKYKLCTNGVWVAGTLTSAKTRTVFPTARGPLEFVISVSSEFLNVTLQPVGRVSVAKLESVLALNTRSSGEVPIFDR